MSQLFLCCVKFNLQCDAQRAIYIVRWYCTVAEAVRRRGEKGEGRKVVGSGQVSHDDGDDTWWTEHEALSIGLHSRIIRWTGLSTICLIWSPTWPQDANAMHTYMFSYIILIQSFCFVQQTSSFLSLRNKLIARWLIYKAFLWWLSCD